MCRLLKTRPRTCLGKEGIQESPLLQVVFASGGKAVSSLTSHDREVSLTFSVLLERRLAHLFTSIWDKEEKRYCLVLLKL